MTTSGVACLVGISVSSSSAVSQRYLKAEQIKPPPAAAPLARLRQLDWLLQVRTPYRGARGASYLWWRLFSHGAVLYSSALRCFITAYCEADYSPSPRTGQLSQQHGSHYLPLEKYGQTVIFSRARPSEYWEGLARER